MLVRHFKNHSPTPQKYVRVWLPTFAELASGTHPRFYILCILQDKASERLGCVPLAQTPRNCSRKRFLSHERLVRTGDVNMAAP